MNHTLITAGTVLPISSKPISKGAVLIAEGKIRAVGKERELKRWNNTFILLRLLVVGMLVRLY
ncbi:MAG: hypothetical protein IH874_01510 [Candidatus Dadabacteria bacterium]|nr:hypothetical protein [Candidatus Dadabacteria bacterium]